MKKVKDDVAAKYQLHKQHLLDQSKADTVLEVVENILGLHATSASTPYLSLFARMKQFQRSMLDQELYIRRNLIRLGFMRRTLFIMTTKLAPIAFQATRLSEAQTMQLLEGWNIPHSEYQRLAESVYATLKDGAQPLRIIKQAMSPRLVRTLERQIGTNVSRMTNVNIALTVLMQQGKVFSEKYRDPIMTQHENRYALTRTVYPHLNLEPLTTEEAQIQLVKHYIRRYGPVTEQDVAWWTGLGKTKIQTIMTTLESELLPIRIKKHSEDYVMLETDFNILKKFKAPRTLPLILLPYEDPFPKGYQLRNRLVTTEHEKHVYIGGQAQPTVFVKGKIVGTWNRVFEEPGETITVQLFQRIGRAEKNAIILRGKALGTLMTRKDCDVIIKTI
ncbi:MAG: winged helix DNA-binding domain-containing protein [Promethearchaeota archaeon]